MSDTSSPIMVNACFLTYNHEKFVAQALESAIQQMVDFGYEIVIGEDGSTDGIRKICVKYSIKYTDKIRLLLRDRPHMQPLRDPVPAQRPDLRPGI